MISVQRNIIYIKRIKCKVNFIIERNFITKEALVLFSISGEVHARVLICRLHEITGAKI